MATVDLRLAQGAAGTAPWPTSQTPAEDQRFKSPNAERAMSGQQITSEFIYDIQLDFSRPGTIASLTASDPARATITGALLVVDTLAAAPVAVTAASDDTITYRVGNEIRCEFTAQFSAQTATSTAFIGPWDGADGFRFGWNGTVWCIEHWRGGILAATHPLATWHNPPDGSADSLFRREGVPEPLNPQAPNLYRMRWEHLGIAPFILELLSPDGDWVTVHVIHFPNLGPYPSTLNPSLPITWAVGKTAGTDIISISSGSAWGGTTGSGAGQRISQFPNRLHADGQVTAVTAATSAAGRTMHTVTSGYRFYATGFTMTATNDAATIGQVNITDGDGGPVKIPLLVPLKQGSGPAGTQTLAANFSEPVPFTTAVVVGIVGANVTASCSIVGYEETV